MSGKLSIYACGGTGVSIVSHFEQFRNKESVTQSGYSSVTPYYVDTSMSDITEDLPREFMYVFEETDGSGKKRAENFSLIKDSVNDILHKFTPGDINVIVSSASGGSGAVVAGYLLMELLRRKIPTIIITVGTCDSRIEIENTIKTLKTYEKASITTGVPVVLSYWQNDKVTNRQEVDSGVRNLITRLSALFSKQHKRLDNTDLANWLNYPKVTDISAKLVVLDVYEGEHLRNCNENVISVATLCREGLDSSAGIPIEYQAVGYVSESNSQTIKLNDAVHFCIVDNLISSIFKTLNKELSVFVEHRNARTSSSRLVTADEASSTEDDIFL